MYILHGKKCLFWKVMYSIWQTHRSTSETSP